MQRPFTSGSRQAPDPFDQYLEENNFYRKHTARDSSCLFRAISEQMYDTQLHHLIIRKNCVRYMRNHRSKFESLVDRDLDEYLDDMSKPKTYGTLIELRAASLIFKRNVFLFEPYTLGNYFIYRSSYTNVFRVFYTPEKHFDSVFTSDYIKDVAICQSIVYEILYKDLFKLPDVTFAVEHMLHSSSLDKNSYKTECNEDGYCTRIYFEDGRVFNFDLPENTYCILENYRLCHFHNPDFPTFSEELQRDLKSTKRDDTGHKFLSRTAESMLPDKYISCVRQLLLEGITPFPYKVAKALDPNMYRNIEFDTWNEARKELKLQNWYNGDTNFKLIKYQKRRMRHIFQVGAKCHVKLFKSENDLFTCHIQEISEEKGYCVVFVEQLGEKRLVPYESLKPLPPDQFKPWSLPYHFQRHMQKCNSYRYSRRYNYRYECCLPLLKSTDDYNSKRYEYIKTQDIIYTKQFGHMENFENNTVAVAYPMMIEYPPGSLPDKMQKFASSRAESRCSENPQPECTEEHGASVEGSLEQETFTQEQNTFATTIYADEYVSYSFDPSIIHAGPQTVMPGGAAPIYYRCNAPGYPQSGGMYMPTQPPPVIAATQNQPGFYQPYYPVPVSGGSGIYNDISLLQSTTTPLSGRINLDVKKSVKANGSDLPTDVATLRYFFNLGLEYHQNMNGNAAVESGIDSKEGIVKVTTETQLQNLDHNDNHIDVKPDLNNNSNTLKGNFPSSNKPNNAQRRYSSRYFNNKERQNYRPVQQGNRYQNDNNHGNNGKNQKTNQYHQKQQSVPNSTPNSRNASSSGNFQRPDSANSLPIGDLSIQTSPAVSYSCAETGELMQTPTAYNSSGQVLGSFVPEYDQPPPQSSGVYMPVSVGHASYGVYAAASVGAGCLAIHSSGGYSYLGGPPPPTAVALNSPVHAGPPPPPPQLGSAYYNSNAETAVTPLNDGNLDPNIYPFVGYPPQVQYYYSPSSGVPCPAGQPAPATPGYWCIPPPIQTHPSPQPQPVAVVPSSNSLGGNRRDQLKSNSQQTTEY